MLRPAGRQAGASSRGDTGERATGLEVASHDKLFVLREAGTDAKAREVGDEFVVLAGSIAKAQEVPSCSEGVKRRRAQLVADGILAPSDDGKLRFTADTPFDSPSAAAAVVYGGNISGPRYWHDATTGQTYGEWRRRQIDEGSAT